MPGRAILCHAVPVRAAGAPDRQRSRPRGVCIHGRANPRAGQGASPPPVPACRLVPAAPRREVPAQHRGVPEGSALASALPKPLAEGTRWSPPSPSDRVGRGAWPGQMLGAEGLPGAVGCVGGCGSHPGHPLGAMRPPAFSCHGVAQHGTAQRGRAQHGTARHGTAWHGSARLGSAWHGSACSGTAWHGSAWHGSSRHMGVSAPLSAGTSRL